MTTTTVQGWALDVERGPDWLFVKMRGGNDSSLPQGDERHAGLAEEVLSSLKNHFVHRLVLDLSELPMLKSYLIGQLVLLQKRISADNGVLRLCGLSDANEKVLTLTRLHERLPNFASRADAVRGHRPGLPR